MYFHLGLTGTKLNYFQINYHKQSSLLQDSCRQHKN